MHLGTALSIDVHCKEPQEFLTLLAASFLDSLIMLPAAKLCSFDYLATNESLLYLCSKFTDFKN